ncbi:MAG: hypothetical protein ACREQ9_24180, partial [Candidatus Binatia bacterium]
DVFVVNKADREGADRMTSELEHMLHMLPGEPSWEVPVIATQAVRDVGIDAVLEAVERHRQHRRSHEKPEGLRRALRREVFDIVEEELAARLRLGLDGNAFEDVLADVDRGALDPYSAAGAILEDRRKLSDVLARDRSG